MSRRKSAKPRFERHRYAPAPPRSHPFRERSSGSFPADVRVHLLQNVAPDSGGLEELGIPHSPKPFAPARAHQGFDVRQATQEVTERRQRFRVEEMRTRQHAEQSLVARNAILLESQCQVFLERLPKLEQ